MHVSENIVLRQLELADGLDIFNTIDSQRELLTGGVFTDLAVYSKLKGDR